MHKLIIDQFLKDIFLAKALLEAKNLEASNRQVIDGVMRYYRQGLRRKEGQEQC